MSQGRFVWFDLFSTDPDRARAYYTELFNWNVKEMDMGPAGTYHAFATGGVPFGGSSELPEGAKKMGAPSHWLAYISTEDVDATVEVIKENGGSVYMPAMDIPGVGRFAVCADPHGAVFAPFKGVEERPEPTREPEVGQYCWHELMTKDLDGATAFYGKVFGWAKGDSMEMGEAGTYQMFNRNDKTTGGMMILPKQAADAGAPAHWLHYTVVKDIDAAIERAESLGGTKHMGPMDIPGGKVAVFSDPTGASFAFWAGEAKN